MITCRRVHLEARCRQRGYTLEQVMPCVVAQDGDRWTIDTEHPAYPVAPAAEPRCLAGTALSTLLSRFGINANEPGCKCRARAAQMNARGCDWCEANIDTIVGWLREEATKRGLPFVDMAGRMLVRRAIRNARRVAN